MPFKHTPVGACLTILRSAVLVVLSASFLTACNPGTTNNNTYNGTHAEMSGGGATKDPGDGSGGSTGDGGGGQGILCGATKNPKLKDKLFVRDIYESIFNYNRKMKTIPLDTAGTNAVSSEAIQVLTSSLKAYFGPASDQLEFTQDNFWINFYKKISFLDEEKTLVPSTDANSPIALPNGCSVVQIAYWDESPGQNEEGTLYVNKRFWNDLNQLNKIGLLAHEYFFKQARKALYKNSDAVRNKVGELLSVQGISPLFKNWVPSLDKRYSEILPRYQGGYKMCKGTSPEDPTAKLLFYQYKSADEMQNIVIPLLESNSINASALKNSSFTFDPRKNEALSTATDLMTFQTVLSGNELEPNGPDSEPNEEANILFDRWFSERHFLTFSLNHQPKSGLNRSLSELSKKGDVIWSNFLPSSPVSISFSIMNPASSGQNSEILKTKSRDELIYSVQKVISKNLMACGVNWPEYDGWIAVLKKEIADSIKNGERPKSFFKWNALLENIEQKKCKNPIDRGLQEELPSLLYSLTINNFDTALATIILGKEDLDPQNWDSLPPARIRVSQNSSVLNFDLECDDYESVFNKLAKKKIPQNPKILMNKNITSVKSIPFDEEPDHVLLRNNGLKKLIRALKNESQTEYRNVHQPGDLPGAKCERYEKIKGLQCDEADAFYAEYYLEKNIEVTNCTEEITSWNPPRRELRASPEICAEVKMKSTNHSYKLYFLIDENENLRFTFHRFMGIVKPRDWAGNGGELIE